MEATTAAEHREATDAARSGAPNYRWEGKLGTVAGGMKQI